MEKKTINEVKKHLINNVEGVSKAEYSTFNTPSSSFVLFLFGRSSPRFGGSKQ